MHCKIKSVICSIFVHVNVNITGMSGKDTLSDAMLGGASDFMNDINTQLVTIRQAKDEDKVTRGKYLFMWILMITDFGLNE